SLSPRSRAPLECLEGELKQGQIDPVTEVARDLGHPSDMLEAEILVQSHVLVILGIDAGDHHMQAHLPCALDELLEQSPPDPLAAVLWSYVHRVLHSRAVAGPVTELSVGA